MSDLRTTDLGVSFGETVALAGVSLDAGVGITALLGPNGSGKTTMLSVLTRGLPRFSGKAEVCGVDVRSRDWPRTARVGYLPQHFDLAGALTVRDTVRYAGWVNGLARNELRDAVEEALMFTDLTRRASVLVRRLSGGQRQRLGLAAAVVHRPQVLLLDEPTVGLDPEQRVRFRHLLLAMAPSVSILLATHLLDDLPQVASDVVILQRGRTVFQGPPAELADLGAPAQSHGHESPIEAGYRSVMSRKAVDGPS